MHELTTAVCVGSATGIFGISTAQKRLQRLYIVFSDVGRKERKKERKNERKEGRRKERSK
jgi:hypothetical protein